MVKPLFNLNRKPCTWLYSCAQLFHSDFARSMQTAVIGSFFTLNLPIHTSVSSKYCNSSGNCRLPIVGTPRQPYIPQKSQCWLLFSWACVSKLMLGLGKLCPVADLGFVKWEFQLWAKPTAPPKLGGSGSMSPQKIFANNYGTFEVHFGPTFYILHIDTHCLYCFYLG